MAYNNIMIYNGGTVLAMTGRDCVSIASDLRLGEQMLTVQTDKQKIFKVDDRIYLGISGLATDCQTVHDRLKFRTDLYKLRENRPLKCEVLATMLSNLLYEHRFGPYFIEPVIAGLNPVTFQPYICAMDLIGCISHPKDFVAVGSAQKTMCGMMEAVWEENMEADALFEATAQVFLSGLERDAASGWGAVVYTIQKDSVSVKTVKGRMD